MAYNLFLHMFTEDDTIRKLKKHPLNSVRDVFYMEYRDKIGDFDEEEVRAVLSEYGWGRTEYGDELDNELKKDRDL